MRAAPRISLNTASPAGAEEVAGESGQVREIKSKVSHLVKSRFGGDTNAAFTHYASNGVVDRKALVKLLGDADVGNVATRGFWADGILKQLDADKDNAISWDEFQRVSGG